MGRVHGYKQRADTGRRATSVEAAPERKLLAAKDMGKSWDEILRYKLDSVATGAQYKVCFCDRDTLPAGRFCKKASDFKIEIGTLHFSGVSCLIKDEKFQRVLALLSTTVVCAATLARIRCRRSRCPKWSRWRRRRRTSTRRSRSTPRSRPTASTVRRRRPGTTRCARDAVALAGFRRAHDESIFEGSSAAPKAAPAVSRRPQVLRRECSL